MIAFHVTPEALEHLAAVLRDGEYPETAGIRAAIVPGGCSGFQYSLEVEDAADDEDEVIVCESGIRIFIDPFSAQYLDGATLDYENTMMGSGFVFRNPNAVGGCGCGRSFYA